MKTLYLHCGTQKTATTVIQSFCEKNQAILEKKGYAYPIFPFKYKHRHQNRNGMFLTWPIINEDGYRDEAQEISRLRNGLDEIYSLFKSCDNVILSDEAMWRGFYKGDKKLGMLLDEIRKNSYQVQLIIYLRRQDQFIESMWNQTVKGQTLNRRTFQEYVSFYETAVNDLDYDQVLDRFAELFGEENVFVKRFADVIKGDGIVSDFLQTIGLELTDEYKEGKSERNTGLYGNSIRIKQLINQLDGLAPEDNVMFIHSLPEAAKISRKEYPCSEFSEEERVSFMKRYEKGNDLVARRFIGDGRPLFSSDYSGPPKRSDDNEKLLEDAVRCGASTDMYLYRELRKTRRELERLQETVEKQKRSIEMLQRRVSRMRHPIRTLIGGK